MDQNQIASVIDWQGTWAAPLFLQAQPPDIVDYHGPMMLKLPENFENLDKDQANSDQAADCEVNPSQLYLIETEERNSHLAETFHLDHGKTRRFAVTFTGNTWDDDIVSFREGSYECRTVCLLPMLYANKYLIRFFVSNIRRS
jgi:hypothetical protein